MEDIIEYLQQIQSNLIGIIIPVITTAAISLVTLIVNTVLQLSTINRQYTSIQYEIMREQYPIIKNHLINLICYFDGIENSKLYSKDFTVYNFVKSDWNKFRRGLEDEKINYVDDYQKNIEKIINEFLELNKIFQKNSIPSSNRRMRKRINTFQSYCSTIYNRNEGLGGEPKKHYCKKDIEKLIKTCDKHYNKF